METNLKSFKELAEAARKSPAYFVQGAILDFTEDIVLRMESQNISKGDLASKLSTSPSYVTKLLGGQNNFTLETMVKVSLAVDAELRIHLQPKGSICQWIGMFDSGAPLQAPVQPAACRKLHGLELIMKAANEELALAA